MIPRPVGGALAALAVLAGPLVAAPPALAAAPDDSLLAHYRFEETTGTVVTDATGHGLHGTVVGGATWTGASLDLPGAANNGSYVALPSGLLAGQTEATVSVEVKADAASLSRPGFLWNLGGTSGNSGSTGSWFTSTNGTLRSTITPTNWAAEQNATWTGTNLTAGVWQNVTTTFADNGNGTSTMTLYVDGTQVAQNAAVTMSPATLADHTVNRLGGSAYAGDNGFGGELAEARIYTAALDAGQVRDLADADARSTADAVLAAVDLGDTSAVTADLVLPTGVTWSTSDASVVTAGGAVTRPASGAPDATATLTATATVRGATGTRTFPVTVPALAAGETSLPPATALAAHYPLTAAFQGSDTTRTSSIGGVTNAVWAEQYVDLTSGYIANNAFTGFTLAGGSMAFSFDVNVSSAATGSPSSTLFTYGSSATATNISYRPFRTATSSAAVVTVGGTQVAVAATDHPQVRDTWMNVTVVLDAAADTLTVYENGVQAAQTTGVTQDASSIGNGVLRLNRDATAFYNVPTLYRDVKVYRSAVTADQASALARVDADFAWQQLLATVDLGDTTQITGDLDLPGAPLITWTSSAPGVVAADGTVTRPAPGAADAPVTLTATLTRGGLTFTQSFDLTVLAQLSDTEKAEADAAALTVTGADALRTIVTLPGTGTVNGSTITWTTGDADVLPLVTDAGTVYADPVRPAYGHPATHATLTARVTSGDATVTRQVPVTVAALPREVPDEAYAFAYFTGNSVAGENIYLAASNGNNALSWSELNGGQYVLTSQYGEKGLRDPFILRSVEGDTFYLIATDLSIGRNGDWGRAQTDGSQYIEIWESTDLVTWSAQRHVKVSPDTAGMTWAPEAYYDDELGEYVVFWASRVFTDDTRTTCITTESGSGCYARMMYATTKDFITFSEPRIWQDTGAARIDSTVLKDGDAYYRFTKDEGGQTGCTDIISERSTSLSAVTTAASLGAGQGWTSVATCIAKNAGFSGAVEGPTIFKANEGDTSPYDYYLYLDNYGGSGYFPLGTNDLDAAAWTRVSGSLPSSRHGTVMPVTANQWNSLTGNPLQTTGSSLGVTASAAQRTATAIVSAADGGQVGGAVTFTAGAWSQTVYLTEDDGVYRATATLPDSLTGTVTVAAAYAGTAEITGSGSQVDVALPTDDPDPEPTATPTAEPTAEPTATPTTVPTTEPTAGPTAGPAPTTPAPSTTTTPAGAPALRWVQGGQVLRDGTTFRPGSAVSLQVTGAAPGSAVRLELHSDPVLIASATTAADGTAVLTGSIPTGTPAGKHHLVLLVDGVQVSSVAVVVQGSTTGGLAATGADAAGAVALTALLLLGAGLTAVLAVRRRRLGAAVD
ncbi:immunoglobulin-like domain-containing protein [Cellulomonas soli]|uniref:immunoglobulin-like domain-containing protein n=1 Tax=Cellulomonas soli TaxID=931535 RepID=UPI003F866CA0